jgi:hypothetical protein
VLVTRAPGPLSDRAPNYCEDFGWKLREPVVALISVEAVFTIVPRRVIAKIEHHLDNLGNLLRQLTLPVAIQSWSLTSLQQRLFKTGGRLIRHARYFILQLAESQLTERLFAQIIRRIERLAWRPT